MTHIEDFNDDPNFPRKLLDKKSYVRIDLETGEPQLIRIEPNVENGELHFDTVQVTIDDGSQIIMTRAMAQAFIESNGCVLLEGFSDWKRKDAN